ncbi:phosphatidic acid phosphatase type 2/haloperoxidase [Aspergillus pseudonomiae]|uniref:Phosphatidic acid phosphatase type 2/haloperoxidase n=1 Tax=Aspergillus pseudonomiae TaxID=1506151 RepID=A0A5N6IAW7_9EURO|nr:phosphatidic acid phosphatase type 2/haloperoxidase [Aspergillus pseudonomiae]KAB8263394.1 phosphatidic acid phosphatase type 2/haloperoxidase [Aspergillus pseudonomiae]KAE8409931.1 phosphatidic acid phosphatase type 2/haloperoxidase [Aspergillus pseudonomiae]
MSRSGLSAASFARPAQSGVPGAVARFYQRSFPAVDYLALGCIVGGWILIQLFVNPFHRLFSLDNKAIQYPFAVVERVPVVWSIIYAGVIPFVLMLLWAATFRPKPYKVQVTILGFLVALMLTSLLTDIIKNAVGRPRPDLISRCIPKKGTPENKLVAWTVCTQTSQHILQEGWRSFPSGHSSFSFGGLGYLSFFLSGQMHVFRPRTDLCRCLVALLPFLCALMVAISRLDDYRHDVYDVTCGSILGTVVAYFSYRRYYPSLRSVICDTPYDKAGITGEEGFHKLPSDEEQQVQRPVVPSSQWGAEEEAYQLSETSSSPRRV